MTRVVWILLIIFIPIGALATERVLDGTGSAGRWVKVARIQNSNPIGGAECTSFSGSLNIQTDYGQAGSEQYYAIFSFGSRGGVIPLLQEYGHAVNRSVGDPSRIEWRVYTDEQGWHYLWFWQSNYSRYAIFNYGQTCGLEYWTYENPPATYTQVWSSIDGNRQYSRQTLQKLSVNESIGIGTSDPGSYQLAVNGNIHTKEVKVDLTGWPDYVFKEDHGLPTLQEVEQHIKEKGRLINIPSAEEVEANGIELGEMNKLLLEKIEELTLYTLQQQKELENQKEKNKRLEERLNNLEKLITINKINDKSKSANDN
ncbi:MAG: hypothetical protein VXW38_04140 [Bacteroidota bacterium]|nr:hypothetical protein [Bacteroidota bacterium]